MSVREQSKNFAGMRSQIACVVPQKERVLGGSPHIRGMGEQCLVARLDYGEIGRGLRAIFAGPGIDGTE
jgi:hypothetical protein